MKKQKKAGMYIDNMIGPNMNVVRIFVGKGTERKNISQPKRNG